MSQRKFGNARCRAFSGKRVSNDIQTLLESPDKEAVLEALEIYSWQRMLYGSSFVGRPSVDPLFEPDLWSDFTALGTIFPNGVVAAIPHVIRLEMKFCYNRGTIQTATPLDLTPGEIFLRDDGWGLGNASIADWLSSTFSDAGIPIRVVPALRHNNEGVQPDILFLANKKPPQLAFSIHRKAKGSNGLFYSNLLSPNGHVYGVHIGSFMTNGLGAIVGIYDSTTPFNGELTSLSILDTWISDGFSPGVVY